MKTKGALIWDFDQPWSVEEIDIGEPRKGGVKVQVARKVIVTVGRSNGADVDKYMSATSKGGTCVMTALVRLLPHQP